MTYVKRNRSTGFKWVLALVLFVLAMTVTFSDVYGNTGRSQNEMVLENQTMAQESRPAQKDDGKGFDADPPGDGNGYGEDNPPAAIPEPGTLILLASGLGAMYVARRRRNRMK